MNAMTGVNGNRKFTMPDAPGGMGAATGPIKGGLVIRGAYAKVDGRIMHISLEKNPSAHKTIELKYAYAEGKDGIKCIRFEKSDFATERTVVFTPAGEPFYGYVEPKAKNGAVAEFSKFKDAVGQLG